MPYGDREAQLEYLREYYARYRVTHAEETAARMSEWFRENQEHAQARRRRNRALERARAALGEVALEHHGRILAAVALAAEYPDTPTSALTGILRPVPDRVWRGFVASLKRVDRARWEQVRA
jgi:hypothetical protein